MKEFTASIEELCNYLVGLSCKENDPGRRSELMVQCNSLQSIAERLSSMDCVTDLKGLEECKIKLNSLNHFLRKHERRDTSVSKVIPDFSRITRYIDKVISDYN